MLTPAPLINENNLTRVIYSQLKDLKLKKIIINLNWKFVLKIIIYALNVFHMVYILWKFFLTNYQIKI